MVHLAGTVATSAKTLVMGRILLRQGNTCP